MTIPEPNIVSKLDSESKVILEKWRQLPEEEKRKFVALDLAWSKLSNASTNTREQYENNKEEKELLVELGRDWCEENGFERTDFDHMFTKE